MKSISTINPAITEYRECLIIKEYAGLIDLKVGVSLDHDVSLHFVSLPVLQTFSLFHNVRSAYPSHNLLTTNRHLCGSGERNRAQRRTKVSLGLTMMQVLELLQLAKRHILAQSDIEQCPSLELRLSEGISK